MTTRIDLSSSEPLAPITAPDSKRPIDIEALLRWSYREELPKVQGITGMKPAGFGGAWGGVERYGELLTVIDATENAYGLVPDFFATVAPHPDALRVGDAVQALEGLTPEFPEDWNPLEDWSSLADDAGRIVQAAVNAGTYVDEFGARRFKTSVVRLIIRHALLGNAPGWEADAPERKTVLAGNGRPRWFRRSAVLTEEGSFEIEVEGLNPKLRIPYPDAYQKTYYDPDPIDTVIARAEYEVWRAALEVLAIELEGVLDSHVVIPTKRAWRPWEGDAPAERRVLDDLTKPGQRLRLWNGVWSVLKGA